MYTLSKAKLLREGSAFRLSFMLQVTFCIWCFALSFALLQAMMPILQQAFTHTAIAPHALSDIESLEYIYASGQVAGLRLLSLYMRG